MEAEARSSKRHKDDLVEAGAEAEAEAMSLKRHKDDLVKADPWSNEENKRLVLLLRIMVRKNMDEYLLLKRCRMHLDHEGSELDSDDRKVLSSRERWLAEWSAEWGSLMSTSTIYPMPFSSGPAPSCAYPCNALQVYSVRVEGLRGGLNWPLDVYGMIAVRDSADHNLNIIYCRTRDTCQTLDEEDRCLALTGPSRAVVLDLETNMVMLEVELKVKGLNESEDKYLSFLAEPVEFPAKSSGPHLFRFSSKLSSLQFMLSNVATAVEATIFIQVVDGSWPVGIYGSITVTVEDKNILLLKFESDKVPVGVDGNLKLSRNVVSVGVDKVLVLGICCFDKDGRMEHLVRFKAAKNGRSIAHISLGSWMLEFLVVWSVVSPEPEGTILWC